jgi:hypothetical protein
MVPPDESAGSIPSCRISPLLLLAVALLATSLPTGFGIPATCGSKPTRGHYDDDGLLISLSGKLRVA